MLTDGTTSDADRDAIRLMATAGETVPIHLWEDRTRGESWVPGYDAGSLVLVNDDFLRTVSNNAVDAGRRTFEFKPIAKGTHRVVFEKRMGWKFTAEDRRVYLIEVVDRTPESPRHG
jgi:predicted secreted protein